MSSITIPAQSVNKADEAAPNGEFAWGAAAIGQAINRTERQMHHLIAAGRFDSVKKVGGQYVAHIPSLRKELVE